MDDLVRYWVESRRGWGAKEDQVVLEPVELTADYAARVIALLVERSGGRVEMTNAEITAVPGRLVLLPIAAEDGFDFETRRLAVSSDITQP